MIEKVNPSHPDKVADRIAGAIVDLAYKKNDNPKIAVEVLLGHNVCNLIIETSEEFLTSEIQEIVERIAGNVVLHIKIVNQDEHLADNQKEKLRCGDNGIFKGVPLTTEQKELSKLVKDLYEIYPTDGKFILSKENDKIICCQSNANSFEFFDKIRELGYKEQLTINPLGEWVGGINVDSGATNRKLGSDMADSLTGGGLHGKDLSKADVAVNIYAFLKAQELQKPVELFCAIGDEFIDGKPYSEIVKIAKEYITNVGGFEKFAEWGLF